MIHGVKAGVFALLMVLVPGAALADPPAADRADPSVARGTFNDDTVAQPNRSRLPRIESGAQAPAADTGGESILVGAVRVEGATALPPSAFAPAIEPWLGRPLSPADLRNLATAIANVARQAGYGLATAWIPEQRVTNGVLRVAIDEGRIDAVEAEGSGKASVEPLLARLASGRPILTAELERRLLIAGDLAGISIGRTRLERLGERNILHVEASREKARGRASLDNWGAGTAGPVRARVEFDLNGTLARGDRLIVGGVVTPLQPREFQFVRAAYTIPVGTAGTEVSISGYAGHSRPGAAVRDRGLDGTSLEAEATVTHPVLRSRVASLWTSLGFDVRNSSLDEQNVRVRDDRIVSASVGVSGLSRLGGGWLRGRLTLLKGLDVLGATHEGDPLASRDDGSAIFTKIAFSAQYWTPIGGAFSLNLAMEGQLASRPLLSSEEMGLGGRSFIRAYDYRELSGDQGAAASAELRYDLKSLAKPLRRVQIYAYGDAGRVDNLRDGLGGGTLASVGGGLRAWLSHGIEAGLEIGMPLKDSPFDSDPQPRLSFTLDFSF
jgi:hemolysin activation/secretion protein